MAQVGHTQPGVTLLIYARVLERKRDTGDRVDALVRGLEYDSADGNAYDATGDAMADR
jgi:hypothetical protein